MKIDKAMMKAEFNRLMARIELGTFFQEFLLEDILFGAISSLDEIDYNAYIEKLYAMGKEIPNPKTLLSDMQNKVTGYREDYHSASDMREQFAISKVRELFNPFIKVKSGYKKEYPIELSNFTQAAGRSLLDILDNQDGSVYTEDKYFDRDAKCVLYTECLYDIIIGKKKLRKHLCTLLTGAYEAMPIALKECLIEKRGRYLITPNDCLKRQMLLTAITFLQFRNNKYNAILKREIAKRMNAK